MYTLILKSIDTSLVGFIWTKIFAASGEEDISELGKHIVLKGRTGSGKSTLVLKLSIDWAVGECTALKGCEAVFLLPLMNLDHSSDLGESVVNHLLRDKEFSPRFLETFIEENQKRVAILLDGYDEFKGKGLQQEKCGNIVRILRKEYLPDIKLLVTTRPGRVNDFLTLNETSQVYEILEVAGFSPSAVDNYIDNVFKQQPQIGGRLRNFLEESYLKTDLACLPLMCCAFCQLAKWTDGIDFKDINTTSSLLDKLIKYLLEYQTSSEFDKATYRIEDETKATHLIRKNEKSLLDENKKFLLDLGKVALKGFLKSEKEELNFTEKDFECCGSNVQIIDWGCKNGILFREDDNLTVNIRFILKIFQEKLAGMYLAHLLSQRDNYFTWQGIQRILEKRRIQLHFKTISRQRIRDLRNVLLFACGSNTDAARVIIGVVVDSLLSRAEDLDLYQKGELHFLKFSEIIDMIEICLQFNYESQSEGKLNNTLKPFFDICKGIRLLETTPSIAKYIGYLMEYSDGLSIEAIEIIRISVDSEFAVRSFFNTFYGIESHISASLHKTLEQSRDSNEYFTEEGKRRKALHENIVKGVQIPQHLLMMVPADVFYYLIVTVGNTLKMKERRKIRQGITRDLLRGLGTCQIRELTLSGLREENSDDWDNVFTMISSAHQVGLQKVALINDGLEEAHMSTLFAALKSLRNLIHLDLSVNKIGNIFVQLLADNPMKNLKTLNLQEMGMSSRSIGHLGRHLSHFPSLQTLNIRSNFDTDDNALSGILDNLHHCPGLEELILSLDSVTQKGMKHLETLQASSLKMLQLLGTPFPQETIQRVSNILSGLDKLEELWINRKIQSDRTSENISPNVTREFADAISIAPSLHRVRALYVKFDSESLFYLFGKTDVESKITRLHEFW